MAIIDKISYKEKCVDGMSPAEVYKCRIEGETYYFKTISDLYSETTYSVKKEAEVMRWLAGKLNVRLRELKYLLDNGLADVNVSHWQESTDLFFYDLARCGIADKWLDIAFCVRDIREYYPNSEYERMFFEMLGVEPDYEKIEYYILLDEMF